MTRATLLHVLDCPTAIGAAEVRELEQLAQAFPYCQTAHLLLAKAAHDQGTMLAGQRLRRAATYAADRTLLRRLIEQLEPVAAPIVVAAAAIQVATDPPPASAEVPAVLTPAPANTEPEPIAEPEAALNASALVGVAVAEVTAVAIAEPEPFPEAVPAVLHIPEEAPVDLPLTAATPEATVLPVFLDQEDTPVAVATPAPAAMPIASVVTAEEDLPAQAPAIRPPVEVGEARFEFGLAETPASAVLAKPAYELPGLIDEWAASAVTRGMGNPKTLAQAPKTPLTAPVVFTPSAFTGDEAVGYAFGESSRLGFSLQLLNLLTAGAEASEAAALTAAAQPAAAALPPCGIYFEPDPLLLGHWATHGPPVPVLPSSLDLINNFLRRQPRLTRPAMLPPPASIQADLSVRSTRAESDLASESLARILVRQGKTARAIEIYEKLMVKQPEKIAYFTTQINQLQPPA